MVKWRIYYADGSTFSSEDGPVENAPVDGAQVVLQVDPTVGVERLYYKHFYVWEEDHWIGVGDQRAPSDGHWGLFDYLRQPGWRKFLAGRSIQYHVFTKILDRAINDPDFGAKSAILPTEENAPR